MSITYTIKADVVDIRKDAPTDEDVFLVDTNVWFWMTYTRASMADQPPRPNQLKDYPDYLSQALSAKARLTNCGLSLSELAHRIEVTEFEVYRGSHSRTTKKEFRHNDPNERNNVAAEIESVWSQVDGMSDTLTLTVDAGSTSSAVKRFHSHPLDGYDLFLLEAMNTAGVVQILTDDGDFAEIPDIVLFTANRRVINAARDCGKLITR
jgi:predicted nucleic acid-binding protein